MPSLFRLGQVLRGSFGKYAITKEIQDTVWFAKNQAEENVVIKGVQGHPRVENERNVLKRFQDRNPYLRPLIDEIEEPSDPPTIVLKYLEDHLLNASIKKTLNRKELKYVSRRILEALKVLHELIGLIYGGNFNLFRPRNVSPDHEEYGLEVRKRQFRYFGPFQAKYEEIASPETIAAIMCLMEEIPQSQTTPFHRTTEKEVGKNDKEFIGKIMMLDLRDRPTSRELLGDE
ncbi:hypothetical protein IFR05_013090 [Cadophora sp. M221]|nr:hypothetical protein IFR05_013090 [Cadophora sp. M221]